MTELYANDLDDLGIDPPKGWHEAFRNPDGAVTVMVIDEDGASYPDAPNVDNSGEDAWEWIEFRNGYERNRWLEDNQICAACGVGLSLYGDAWIVDDAAWNYGDDEAAEIARWSHCPASGADPQIHVPTMRPTDILIERYEHGLVNYAPIGESSHVDRQWDVAHGVAVIRFTKPDDFGPADDPDRLLNAARGICQEYTSWCNGDIYGMIRYELVTTDRGNCPFLTVDDYTRHWVETDSCWGFLGYDYAHETAKTGEW